MGRYFYRPAPAVDPGYDELGGDIAQGISTGVANYGNEQDRMREEGRQAKADTRTEQAWQIALAKQNGGMGPPPRNAGTPDLDFGQPGMEAGTSPNRSPLSPFTKPQPTDGTQGTPGAAALSIAGPKPPPSVGADIPMPGSSTRSGTSAVRDFVTSPGAARKYRDIGGGAYIEDPEEMATRQAEQEYQTGRSHATSEADQAWDVAQGHQQQEIEQLAGELQHGDKKISPEEAHRRAALIIQGHASMRDFDPQAYLTQPRPATPRAPARDYSKPTYEQATKILQSTYAKHDSNGYVIGYTKTPEEIDRMARSMASGQPLDQATGQAPAAGGQGRPGGKSFRSFAGVPDNIDGSTGAPPAPGAGPGAPQQDPWEEVRAELQNAGLEGQDAADALAENGYDQTEIDQILGGV